VYKKPLKNRILQKARFVEFKISIDSLLPGLDIAEDIKQKKGMDVIGDFNGS
jgi:hypothetical protein